MDTDGATVVVRAPGGGEKVQRGAAKKMEVVAPAIASRTSAAARVEAPFSGELRFADEVEAMAANSFV